MDVEPGELTVGQLSQRSGVAVSALHFYERQELIVSRRTSGNQRRYKRDTLRRVALIRIAQRVGIPLADVAAILAMADALGLEVTAEGVETHDQLANLQRLHCGLAQGFYLARPMPADAITKLVTEAHRWKVD